MVPGSGSLGKKENVKRRVIQNQSQCLLTYAAWKLVCRRPVSVPLAGEVCLLNRAGQGTKGLALPTLVHDVGVVGEVVLGGVEAGCHAC